MGWKSDFFRVAMTSCRTTSAATWTWQLAPWSGLLQPNSLPSSLHSVSAGIYFIFLFSHFCQIINLWVWYRLFKQQIILKQPCKYWWKYTSYMNISPKKSFVQCCTRLVLPCNFLLPWAFSWILQPTTFLLPANSPHPSEHLGFACHWCLFLKCFCRVHKTIITRKKEKRIPSFLLCPFLAGLLVKKGTTTTSTKVHLTLWVQIFGSEQ